MQLCVCEKECGYKGGGRSRCAIDLLLAHADSLKYVAAHTHRGRAMHMHTHTYRHRCSFDVLQEIYDKLRVNTGKW